MAFFTFRTWIGIKVYLYSHNPLITLNGPQNNSDSAVRHIGSLDHWKCKITINARAHDTESMCVWGGVGCEVRKGRIFSRSMSQQTCGRFRLIQRIANWSLVYWPCLSRHHLIRETSQMTEKTSHGISTNLLPLKRRKANTKFMMLFKALFNTITVTIVQNIYKETAR